VQPGAVLSSDPRHHAKVIDVGMRDDRIRHLRCFAWVPRRVGWCKPVIKEKTGSRRVFHDDAHVPNLIATAKAMKPHTGRRWKGRIGRGSSWTVHHHARSTGRFGMNLWEGTPWFPLEEFLGEQSQIFAAALTRCSWTKSEISSHDVVDWKSCLPWPLTGGARFFLWSGNKGVCHHERFLPRFRIEEPSTPFSTGEQGHNP